MTRTPRMNILNVEPLVRKISQAKSILLTTHKQCDGDGLGALLALYHGLKKSGYNVRAVTVDAVPRKYDYLEHHSYSESFEGPHQPLQNYDLALIFDTNDQRLVEPLYSSLTEKCREILFVDHHPVLNMGPEPTSGSYIETNAASTGEIAYFIIKGMNIHFDERMATALYTSIAFDTQLFKYVKSSTNSHLIAAELIGFIPNPEDIHRSLFSTYSREKVTFLSKAFGDIEYFGNNTVAVLRLHKQDLLDHNLDMDDSRDVIDTLMQITSLQAAALFREDAPNEYKMSLRSKGHIEVLGVAEAFKGGGHMFASGAYIKGEYPEIRKKVVELLLSRLDHSPTQPNHHELRKKARRK